MFCCFAFKSTGICSVLCISSLKKYMVFTCIYCIFCVFVLFPLKTLKRKNAVIYTFCNFRKTKNRPKNVSKRHFRYPQNGGGAGLYSWRRLWATRIPSKKLSPSRVKDFWCFSGPGVGGSAAWGALHHRALVRAPARPRFTSRPLPTDWSPCNLRCILLAVLKKHCFFYGVSGPSGKDFHLGDVKKHPFLRGFGLQQVARNGKICIIRSFQPRWPKHGPNIAPKRAPHGPT